MIEVEAVKRRLSFQEVTEVFIESLEGGRNFSETFTQTKVGELVSDLVKETAELIEWTLKNTQT